MALVLWLMDEEMMKLTGRGTLVPASDGLSKPMEVAVLPIESPYNFDDYLRIVKFSMGSDGINVEHIKGEDCPEGDALSELCLDPRNDANQTEFVLFARKRFHHLIQNDVDVLDADIKPLLTHPKWLSDNVLVPFWSCSGHISDAGTEPGYICLIGELSDLKAAEERLTGQYREVYVDFLNYDVSDHLIYMHPVLALAWDVDNQTDIDEIMTKLTRALESGLFDC